jgi:hypothetical protein
MDITRIVDEAASDLGGIRKAVRAGLDEITVAGLAEPDDDTFMAWVASMAGAGNPELGIAPGKYPPVAMIAPDGAPIMVSPWLESMNYVDGGESVVARILRIQRKLGAS